jgi:hypothetical protein
VKSPSSFLVPKNAWFYLIRGVRIFWRGITSSSKYNSLHITFASYLHKWIAALPFVGVPISILDFSWYLHLTSCFVARPSVSNHHSCWKRCRLSFQFIQKCLLPQFIQVFANVPFARIDIAWERWSLTWTEKS